MMRNNTKFTSLSVAKSIRLSIICTVLMLSACGNEDFSDLDQFIAKVKAKPKKEIEALPERKTVEPFLFDLDGSRDPFRPVQKVDEELEEEDDESVGPGIQPDFDRRKEDLESYPLDALKMVGTVKKDGVLWGLVKSEDGVQRVKEGNYMGTNHGKITKIEEMKIDLMEIVKDKKPKTWREEAAVLPLETGDE